MRCLLIAIAFAVIFAGPAYAQMPVYTNPVLSTTAGSNASGTIAATNTFQKVFSATTNAPTGPVRKGCIIQNRSTDTMYVSEGNTVATATTATSFALVANGVFYCDIAGVTLYGEIDITGTATDTFYAVQY